MWNRPGLSMDDKHRYWLDGVELESVSSFLGRFREPFDRAAVSRQSALKAEAKRRKTTQRDVAKDWPESDWAAAAKAIRATWDAKTDAGTYIHTAAQELLEHGIAPPDRPYTAALLAWVAARQPAGLGYEVMLCWPDAGIAGTFDLAAVIHDVSWLVDYKTNADIYLGNRRQCKEPIANLPDNTWVKHTLQLSCYRRMADEYEGTPRVQRSMVVQFRDNGTFREYYKPYLPATVEAMVAYTKREHA